MANRFIKHALASAISPANFASSSGSKSTHIRFNEDEATNQESVPAPASKPEPASSSSDSDGEPEVGTWKAKKRAREADLAEQREAEENESDEEEEMEGWEDPSAKPAAPTEEVEPQADTQVRSKRPRMDPFAGMYLRSRFLLYNFTDGFAITTGYSGSTPRSTKRSVAVTQPSATTSSATPQSTNTSQPDTPPPPPPSSATSTSLPARRRKARRGTSHPRKKKTRDPKEGPSTSDPVRNSGPLAREAVERAAAEK